MPSTLSPISRRLSTRRRSRSREHTGRSRSRSRSVGRFKSCDGGGQSPRYSPDYYAEDEEANLSPRYSPDYYAEDEEANLSPRYSPDCYAEDEEAALSPIYSPLPDYYAEDEEANLSPRYSPDYYVEDEEAVLSLRYLPSPDYYVEDEEVDLSPRYSSLSDSIAEYAEEEESEDGNSTDSETAVMFAEPNVLDCSICREPLCSRVYQCKNGHLACDSCYSNKIEIRCPNCRSGIKYRSTAIEQVLESLPKTPCRNMEHGCGVTLNSSQKSRHEESCKYAPCSCPHDACNYVGSSSCLYMHFSVAHPHSSTTISRNYFHLNKDDNKVFLQESYGSTLFVLNRKIELSGSSFNVVCIAPASSGENYTYKLKASTWDKSICLRGEVEIAPECSSGQQWLQITNEFAETNGCFSLKLRIRRERSDDEY